jgi:hypothetical protein
MKGSAMSTQARFIPCLILNYAGLDDVTYYVGHETVVSRKNDQALPKWRESLFAAN